MGRLRVRALIRKHARRRGSAAAGPGRCRLPGPGRRAWPGAPGFLHVISHADHASAVALRLGQVR